MGDRVSAELSASLRSLARSFGGSPAPAVAKTGLPPCASGGVAGAAPPAKRAITCSAKLLLLFAAEVLARRPTRPAKGPSGPEVVVSGGKAGVDKDGNRGSTAQDRASRHSPSKSCASFGARQEGDLACHARLDRSNLPSAAHHAAIRARGGTCAAEAPRARPAEAMASAHTRRTLGVRPRKGSPIDCAQQGRALAGLAGSGTRRLQRREPRFVANAQSAIIVLSGNPSDSAFAPHLGHALGP